MYLKPKGQKRGIKETTNSKQQHNKQAVKAACH
jgi:hypothetical protein